MFVLLFIEFDLVCCLNVLVDDWFILDGIFVCCCIDFFDWFGVGEWFEVLVIEGEFKLVKFSVMVDKVEMIIFLDLNIKIFF